MGVDMEKAAFGFASLAFQLHTLTIAFDGYTVGRAGYDDRDDAIKAFLVIAYLLLLSVFILLLVQNYAGELQGNKIVTIVVCVVLFAAAACIIIGVVIYGATDKIAALEQFPNPFSVTTFVVGAASALVAGIFIVVQLACGGK